MRKFLLVLGALLLLAPPALAQPSPGPGPGPVPDPWLVNGNVISYPGGVVVGAPSGSPPVPGSINASVGYAVNGNRTAQSATGPLVLNPTTGVISCPTCATGTGGALTAGVTPTSGYSNTQILGSNGTVLSAYSVSGTGNVALTNSPSITTPTINFGTGFSNAINASSTNTGFFNAFQAVNNGTASNSNTLVIMGVNLGGISAGDLQMRAQGGATPIGIILADAGLTGGLTISALGGPLNITNPILSTPTISSALTYGGVTLANSVTGTGSMVLGNSPSITTPNIVLGTGASSALSIGSVNTGFTNELVVNNGGTVSNASTGSNLFLNLNSGTNTYLELSTGGGSSPIATITSGLGLTGGMNIFTQAGPLTIATPTITGSFTATGLVTNADLVNPATTVNGVSCVLGGTCTIVASAGSITAGTTLVNGGPGVLSNATNGGVLVSSTTLPSGLAATNLQLTTPAIAFGTGASSIISASSVNTGFTNLFNVQNGGTVSNTSTIAQILANLSGVTNAFLIMQASGGASPIATISTGSGLTGGLQISAGAGTLNITSPSINGGTLTGTIGGTPTLSGSGFITRANIVPVAAVSLIGNPTGSSASESAITLGSTLNFSGTTLNCTAGSASQVGCYQIDGTTLTVVSGKLQASGASATAITSGAGGTTIGGTTFAGGVLTNVAGVVGTTTAGTLGQALVSNGGTSPPTFQSGTWVLLNTLTAAGSASLDDTTHITSSYNDYMIVLENVLPATNATTCQILVHSGGAFQSTGYQSASLGGNNGAAFSQTVTTYIPCGATSSGANTGIGVSGEFTLFTPSTSALHSVTGNSVQSSGVNAGTVISFSAGGFWNTAAVVDGFRVIMSSGNITSGTVKLYGRL